MLFYASCRFLSRSRTHSQTSFVVFRFMVSLAALCLSLSFTLSPSASPLIPHSALLPVPLYPTCLRISQESFGLHEREPPLFSFHHQSSNRDLTYPRRRTMTYSHSRPTCRIILNSPAITRIIAVSLASTGLSKCERVRSRVTSLRYCERVNSLWKFRIVRSEIALKLRWSFAKIDSRKEIYPHCGYFGYQEDASQYYRNTSVSL